MSFAGGPVTRLEKRSHEKLKYLAGSKLSFHGGAYCPLVRYRAGRHHIGYLSALAGHDLASVNTRTAAWRTRDANPDDGWPHAGWMDFRFGRRNHSRHPNWHLPARASGFRPDVAVD